MSLVAPSRPGRRLLGSAGRLLRGMGAHGALDSARLMAFDFFLSLVPLLVLLGFVLGRLIRKRGVEALVGPLLETIPDASADLARHELERLAGSNAGSIAPLSLVTFLWLTSSGVHQMMDVLEVASCAPRRKWLKQRAVALAAVVLGVATLSFTAWALIRGDDLVHRPDDAGHAAAASAPASARSATRPPRPKRDPSPSAPKRTHLLARVHSGWERVVVGGALLVVGVFGLAAFYRFAVEHPRGVARRAWPGALAAMATWLAVSWLFGSYIGSLATYTVYYGGLAAVAVLLMWLFLTSLALLFGAEVNAMLEGVGAHEGG